MDTYIHMGIDSDLLQRQQDEETARELKKRQVDEGEQTDTPPPLNYRQAIRQAQNAKKAKELVSGATTGGAAAAGSSKLLRSAWLNLISSWGLTLIWINVHVFLSKTMGERFFVRLGMEWVPDSIKKSNAELAEKMQKGIAIGEIAALVLLDLLAMAIIILVIAIIMYILDAVGGILGIFV